MAIEVKHIKRIYSMEDDTMETRAETMYGNLLEDLADFTLKFPWIDAAYAASFLSDINTAKTFTPDSSVQGIIKVLTEDVNASMNEGKVGLSSLNHYAREAFNDSPARQRIFGQDDWDVAYGDQQKMQKALHKAHDFADEAEYKAPLLVKGYTQAAIDMLETIAGNIETKDRLQEHAKAGRPVTTEDRIKVHNIVWERQQSIANCAEEVYREDAAMRDKYLLYPKSHGTDTVTVEYDLTLGPILNVPAPEGVEYSASLQMKLEVSGAAPGSARAYFCQFANNPPGPADPFMQVNVGEDATGEAGANLGYNATRTFLNVQNTGPSLVHVKITFFV